MRYDPNKHHRRAMRLRGCDYSQNGAYYLTLCTQHRLCLYGEIIDDKMELNDAGRMIERFWLEIPKRFTNVELDLYVVMPNHMHGIVAIAGKASDTIPAMMQQFKTFTTNAYIRGVKKENWQSFPGKLWQRSYYDHIVRNEAELNAIRHYIETNAVRWNEDQNNPINPM
jgi:putative transposase